MIYYYGDSYVENTKVDDLDMIDHERYYDMVSKNMNEGFNNFGKAGEGPWTTLTKFHDHLYSDRFNSNSKFVFVLSNPYRIPWTFLESKGISATTTYADWIAKQDGRDHLIEGDYTSEEFYAIDSMYRSLQEEINHQNFKNITYLHTISKANNWPMIVFRVFGISPDPFGKEYDEDKIIKPFTDLNDDSFKFYTSPLELQSSKEWKRNPEQPREGIPDQSTINHFTHRNHIILSNIITNHFKKNYLNEVWHERFIRDFEKIERNNKQLVDYIYN